MSQKPISAATDLDLVARLRLAVGRLNRQVRLQSTGGLGLSSQSALFAIVDEGPMTLGALATREHVVPSMITKLVTQLEEEGLVARRVDPSDGRVRMVTATAAGRSRVREIRNRRDAWLATRVSALAPEELDSLWEVIDILEHLALPEPDR